MSRRRSCWSRRGRLLYLNEAHGWGSCHPMSQNRDVGHPALGTHLVEVEVYPNRNHNWDRRIALHRRPEPVLPHSLQRLFIQSLAKGANNARALRNPLCVYDCLDNADTLIFGSSRLI